MLTGYNTSLAKYIDFISLLKQQATNTRHMSSTV